MMNFTRKHFFMTAGLSLFVIGAHAQQLRKEYVQRGPDSPHFPEMVTNWSPTSRVTEDDNFFISRVKPHVRFRNAATQVRPNLNAENDKKLLMWVPVNNPEFNALPDGVFDSEVFSMWSYVTHYGDWTATQGRVPGAFLDVAHKNGVPVSGVAGIGFGALNNAYRTMLFKLGTLDANHVGKFLNYFGVDGLGYNSEFSASDKLLKPIRVFHENLVKFMRPKNPLFENIWYDGTDDKGVIRFDHGLANHNQETFGDKDHVRTSLFFNYNWDQRSQEMKGSVEKARQMGRDPLDLYCGINMQGGQPAGGNWGKIANLPLSIGLWGAHERNMFWESRGEKGSSPEVMQRTYLNRIERYFTGGTRNPANCPPILNTHAYHADNFWWHGMSTFMTARSALKWNLAEEPFVTYFNLGNGHFFNVKGERKNNNPWYNVGMQDYLPTWRWWFANKLLGNTAQDVPAKGLDAAFTWDDAYFGGSTIRISGSTADEYLHLFKTEYQLKSGDVITFRYKLAGGTTKMDLLLSAKGSEKTAKAYNLLETSYKADDEVWVEKKFVVNADFDGKELALVALHFTDANHLDMLLGEFSIVRGSFAAPEKPTITAGKMLNNSYAGMDAKLIWNMANNKPADEPCYNLDVKTSYFNLYAQEEGEEPVFMGTTTSWAGFYFSIPSKKINSKVRLGVSAVALDHKAESEIAWTEYMEPVSYIYSDDVEIDKTTIKPGEKFTLKYVDGHHDAGTWKIVDEETGQEMFSGNGQSVTVENGLQKVGSYTLKLEGKVGDGIETRTFPGFIQITDLSVGALPEILTLTANDSKDPITIKVGDKVTMKYTGRPADGAGSQGVDLEEKRYGVKADDLGLLEKKTFSVAYWLKINKLSEGETQFFSIANKLATWPETDWGWIWTTLAQDGSVKTYTFRGARWTDNNELQYKFANSKLPIGTWVHVAMVFEYNQDEKFRSELYLNGKKQKVTGWKRSKEGGGLKNTDPGFQPDVFDVNDGMVMAVGGNAHGRNGIDGSIDNFQVWNKAMTEEDVKTSMRTLDPKNLPAGLLALWDNEAAAAEDGTFAAVGPKAGVKAGLHSYEATKGEGRGIFKWEKPKYTSGCPFVAGTTYRVETLPTWSAPKADIISASGNDRAGEAVLSYDKEGVRNVTLTLTNSLGKAKRTFTSITIGGKGIRDAKNTGEVKVYNVEEDVLVEFAQAGNYTVSVYTIDGKASATKSAAITAGGNMKIHLAHAGVYVLTVKKDGKVIRSMKLLRK